MFNIEQFKKNLFTLTSQRKFLLAYSGGLDSHVLLHVMYCLRQQYPEITLRAIHIHHGLSPHADQWAAQCEKNCRDWNIDFQIKKIDLDPLNGDSLEAAARKKRYKIFEDNLQDMECLITAHTQSDQAETLMMRLLRGSGVRGLGAMQEKKKLSGNIFLRPLLSFLRSELEQYAIAHQLAWIEDESNLDLRFDRNYLRHKIFPLLKTRWPRVSETFSQTAHICGETQALLNELADRDLEHIYAARNNSLNIKKLRDLSFPQQRNVLRRWLELQNVLPPSFRQMQQIQNELLPSREDAVACVKWGKVQVNVYQNCLYLLKQHDALEQTIQIPWNLKDDLQLPSDLGVLKTELCHGGGLHFKYWGMADISVRFRRGGEQCQLLGRSGTRLLKKLFQEWQVPPWQRERVPLIFYKEQLIAVVGYCICKGYEAEPTEQAVKINFSA